MTPRICNMNLKHPVQRKNHIKIKQPVIFDTKPKDLI